MARKKCLTVEIILAACLLARAGAVPKPEANATLSTQGSHLLLKLADTGEGGKRSSRCSPCGDDPEERRPGSNHLDPEYRGNGADNLGYDWSPRAWGGPAFMHRMRTSPGRVYPMAAAWDRGRGGRTMNWSGRGQDGGAGPCDRCRGGWDPRGGRAGFDRGMGRWQDGGRGYPGDVATVTSPTIALRPEGRIAYVPSPNGEMYWDGVSGGGTRWDGFSNGISWLGRGGGGYDGGWRGGDPRGNRGGYDQGPKRPDEYPGKDGGSGYYRPWGGEPKGPSWYYPGKGYGDRGLNMDQDMRYNGYASKWHYGTTNQNGWNGNNMKWNYGGNRDGYYGGPPGGKFDEDSNPLPHGPGGPHAPSGTHGPGGTIQYGQGGSVYYDQGNYIFHYGQGASSQHPVYEPNRYPQDGKPSPYPSPRPEYEPRPTKPWDYNTNDRHDNRDPGYSNINWIRPGPPDPGYPKPASHGKYPSGGYEEKGKPWPQRPTGGYGQGRPEPGSGYPQGPVYVTGSVSHAGDRYPGGGSPGGYGGGRPGGYGGGERPGHGGYPGGSGGAGRPGGGSYPAGGGYPGVSGGSGYPSGGSGYPGGSGGPVHPSGYPGGSGGSGYPGGGSGTVHPIAPTYPGGSGGYPSGGSGKPGYPTGGGSTGYPGGPGYPSGSGGPVPVHPGGSGGSGYPGGYPGDVGPGYPGSSGRPGYPGGSSGSVHPGGSGYPGGSGGPVHPGGSGYPGGSGGPVHPGGSGYPGGSGGGSGYPGSSGGGPGYPGSSGGGPGYPGSGGGPVHPGGSGYPEPGHRPSVYPPPPSGGYGHSRPGGDGGYGRPDGGPKGPERPGGYGGNYLGPDGRPPPKGYYTGFITELDGNDKYPNSVNIGGNRYPPGGSYPIRDKDSYPGYGDGRYPGGGGGGPDGYSGYPSTDRDRYNGGNRYPEYPNDRDQYRPGSQDRYPGGGGDFDKGPSVNEEGSAWNYGQDGHKDGIYRRAGGSYPPYRGGPYYTSSYLASASTPAVSSQSPSEGKTQSVTKADEVTKPTPAAA